MQYDAIEAATPDEAKEILTQALMDETLMPAQEVDALMARVRRDNLAKAMAGGTSNASYKALAEIELLRQEQNKTLPADEQIDPGHGYMEELIVEVASKLFYQSDLDDGDKFDLFVDGIKANYDDAVSNGVVG